MSNITHRPSNIYTYPAIDLGQFSRIVKNRESRIATLLAHTAMIPTFFWLLPMLRLFPTAVFHGVFLYLAYTSMIGNELWQRVKLLFTEQVIIFFLFLIIRQCSITHFSILELSKLSQNSSTKIRYRKQMAHYKQNKNHFHIKQIIMIFSIKAVLPAFTL